MRIRETISFEKERDMALPAMRCLADALFADREALSVATEMAVGRVIPDILFANWREGIPHNKRALNMAACEALAVLERRGGASWGAVSAELFFPKYLATETLRNLLKHRLVIEDGDRIVPSQAGRTDHVELVAIELKLSRWREALEQAIQYQQFADRAYVVLDAQRVTVTEPMRVAFEAAGVGLLLLSNDCIECICEATSTRNPSGARTLAYAKAIRTSRPIC